MTRAGLTVPRPADRRPRLPVRGGWLPGRAHNEGVRDLGGSGGRGRPLDDWVSHCAALGRTPPWNLNGKRGTRGSTRSFLRWHGPRTEAPPQGRRILDSGSLRRHLGGRVGCFTTGEGLGNMVGSVVSARPEVGGHQLGFPEAPHHCRWSQQTQGGDTLNTLLMAFLLVHQTAAVFCMQSSSFR